LGAEADAVDAVGGEDGGAVGVESIGVGFDGELGKRGRIDGSRNEREQLGEVGRIEEGGGTAADEDGMRLDGIEVLAVEGDFLFEGV